ncbi:MAG: PstS family phosphate ABC transporter substrate-binding protein [Rhodothermaceae bacterium]
MKIYLSVIFLAFFTLFSGCTSKNKTRISIKGSDTMLNFVQLAAEKYMSENKNVSISLSGGGSGTGIAALINGTANIANISRSLKTREIQLINKHNRKFEKIPVGLDGVVVIVNSSNPVESLTVKQLMEIYSGKITNWNQVGGEDKKIILYSRENSSGTYEFFRKKVLNFDKKSHSVDFSTGIQLLQGTSAVAQAVSHDNYGIGYGGIGYFRNREDVKILKIAADENREMISPIVNGKIDFTAIENETYFLSRQLHCYINTESKQEVLDFINFLRSDFGQKIIEDSGFIPLQKQDE